MQAPGCLRLRASVAGQCRHPRRPSASCLSPGPGAVSGASSQKFRLGARRSIRAALPGPCVLTPCALTVGVTRMGMPRARTTGAGNIHKHSRPQQRRLAPPPLRCALQGPIVQTQDPQTPLKASPRTHTRTWRSVKAPGTANWCVGGPIWPYDRCRHACRCCGSLPWPTAPPPAPSLSRSPPGALPAAQGL